MESVLRGQIYPAIGNDRGPVVRGKLEKNMMEVQIIIICYLYTKIHIDVKKVKQNIRSLKAL